MQLDREKEGRTTDVGTVRERVVYIAVAKMTQESLFVAAPHSTVIFWTLLYYRRLPTRLNILQLFTKCVIALWLLNLVQTLLQELGE